MITAINATFLEDNYSSGHYCHQEIIRTMLPLAGLILLKVGLHHYLIYTVTEENSLRQNSPEPCDIDCRSNDVTKNFFLDFSVLDTIYR